MRDFRPFRLADDPDTYGEDAGKWLLTDTEGDAEFTGPMEKDEICAFAAAPYLLAALRDVVNYFWNPCIERPALREGDVEEIVRAAIARAEGRMPFPGP